MSDVVSFRPDDEERNLIDAAQRQLGFATRAETVRALIRRGAQGLGKDAYRALFELRFPELEGKSMTSREIDEELYGDP